MSRLLLAAIGLICLIERASPVEAQYGFGFPYGYGSPYGYVARYGYGAPYGGYGYGAPYGGYGYGAPYGGYGYGAPYGGYGYGAPYGGYGYGASYGGYGYGASYGGYGARCGYGFPYGYGYSARYGYGTPYGYGFVSPYGYTAPGPYIYYGLGNLTNPGAMTPSVMPLGVPSLQTANVPLVGPDLADGLGAAQPVPDQVEPSQRPVAPSSTAARLKSLEKQSIGDEKLRKQQWAKAYIDYRAAVDAAPDRAEAHYRLGFLFTAMQHHASAVREFKRGVFLDPTLPQTGDKLESLFGPDSQIVRNSIMHKVAEWLKEDLRDPDRLFLFGLLLHYEDDARGSEVLEAAQRVAVKGGRSTGHIVAFLTSPSEKSAEAQASAEPKPTPGFFDLPKPNSPFAAPGGSGPTPLDSDKLPQAPLPAAPIDSGDASQTLPRLSSEATPPGSGLAPKPSLR